MSAYPHACMNTRVHAQQTIFGIWVRTFVIKNWRGVAQHDAL